MTLDIKQFSALQKSTQRSFHQQKMLIKSLMAGKKVLCPHCQQPLKLNLPSAKENKPASDDSHITCIKGCTDIQLDFV